MRLGLRKVGVFVAVASIAITAGSATATGAPAPRPGAMPAPVKGRIGDTPAAAPAAQGVLVRFAPSGARRGRSLVTARPGVRGMARIAGTGNYLVRLAAGTDPVSIADDLNRDPSVRLAEPNWLLHTTETVPNDPLLAEQWGLRNTGQSHTITDPPPGSHAGIASADGHVTQAWDTTQGSPSTVVAVLDTGVDLTHPDLVGNLWANPGETPANGIDDDGNGFIDDVNGWDFYGDDDTPQDAHGHGTHVAGIVAATANNGVGGAGVCPNCRIMVLRAGSPSGSFASSDVLGAIAYARSNGANVLNMSIGGGAWSAFQRNAIESAGAHGVLVVAAAGNDGSDNDYLRWSSQGPLPPNYPSSYDLPNLISVAASTDRDFYGYFTGCAAKRGAAKCLFTNWGRTSVDVAAPGVDIDSTWLPSDYAVLNGTSMASPFVAGVAGLVVSQHPDYSPAKVKNAILNSVDRPRGLSGRFMVTDGRVNADAALTASTKSATPRTDGTIEGAVLFRHKRAGSLSGPSDINDVYRIRLVKGHHYAAALRVPKGHDFDVYVWKPGTTDTWPLDYGCGSISCRLLAAGVKGKGDDESFRFTPHKSGTYYLAVTTALGRGKYTLIVGHP